MAENFLDALKNKVKKVFVTKEFVAIEIDKMFDLTNTNLVALISEDKKPNIELLKKKLVDVVFEVQKSGILDKIANEKDPAVKKSFTNSYTVAIQEKVKNALCDPEVGIPGSVAAKLAKTVAEALMNPKPDDGRLPGQRARDLIAPEVTKGWNKVKFSEEIQWVLNESSGDNTKKISDAITEGFVNLVSTAEKFSGMPPIERAQAIYDKLYEAIEAKTHNVRFLTSKDVTPNDIADGIANSIAVDLIPGCAGKINRHEATGNLTRVYNALNRPVASVSEIVDGKAVIPVYGVGDVPLSSGTLTAVAAAGAIQAVRKIENAAQEVQKKIDSVPPIATLEEARTKGVMLPNPFGENIQTPPLPIP